MKYRGVVFDLDGTLLDTLGDILVAVNTMLDQLGYPAVTYDALKTMIGDGAYRMIERATKQTDAAKLQLAVDMYNATYRNTRSATVPFEGICELLDTLAAEGIMLGVLSNKPHRDAVEIVERVLGDRFAVIIGQSEEYPAKPDTRGLSKIVETFGVSISECMYVGDGEMDYLTPTKLDMPVVSALWGYRTRAQLEKVGATRFIEKPNDVIDILK